jgi:NitT/TauT family transport system ATP-binding protein
MSEAATATRQGPGPHEAGPDRPRVELKDVRIVYQSEGRLPVIAADGVNLTVGDGEFLSIVGPSGCGKTTLLKAVIGLLQPTAGQVMLDGEPVREVPPQAGLLFQADTLLPWARVVDNVEIGLKLRRVDASRRAERATELIRMVGLEGFEQHYPGTLSGGMRKRTQLAQLLAYDPEILLMDEPFGALDAQTKIVVGRQFLNIWQQLRKSVIFVTHDLEEAIALSDRVVVMTSRPGRIKSEHRITLPRPRDFYEVRMSEEFRAIQLAIWRELAEEVDAASWAHGQ